MMQRDSRLGEALRAVLTLPDEAGFVRRVLAHIEGSGTWWDVLGRWARLGMAAALLLAAAAGFWLGRHVSPTPTMALDEFDPASGTAGQVTTLLNASRPPNVDVLLAVTSGRD